MLRPRVEFNLGFGYSRICFIFTGVVYGFVLVVICQFYSKTIMHTE